MPPGCAIPFPKHPGLFRADGIGVAQGPRDFAISPCGGKFCETPGRFDQRIRGDAQSQLILRTGFVVVGNQDLDTVVAYTMDAGSGKLTKASELSFPAPVAVLIV